MKLGGRALCAAAVAATMALAQSAWAQGCVMCYTSASALDKRGIHSLDAGILVLFFPPALMFGGILYFLHRRRAASAADSSEDFALDFDTGGGPPASSFGQPHD